MEESNSLLLLLLSKQRFILRACLDFVFSDHALTLYSTISQRDGTAKSLVYIYKRKSKLDRANLFPTTMYLRRERKIISTLVGKNLGPLMPQEAAY